MRKNWKKTLGILCICICFSTGCSKNNSSKLSQSSSVDDVLEQQVADAENENTQEKDSEVSNEQSSGVEPDKQEETGLPETENVTAKNGDIDYDLTTMGSDMVYATVYQMMVSPKDYIGKKIKMTGKYYATFYEPTKQYYHYIIIKDAAACCEQGMEFVWEDGSHVYPDEYPEDETEVEVVGIFETYTEEGDTNEYCHLINAEMTVVEK